MQHHSHRFLTRSLPGFSALRHSINGLAAIAFCLLSTSAFSQDLVITGVVDGPLPGGIPKAVEIYVINDVADLSNCGLGSANNGGGSDGEEFTFPADAVAAGSYIYVATESVEFANFFGFSPDYTSGTAASINGDDAVELFCGGLVVDVFGDIMYGTGISKEGDLVDLGVECNIVEKSGSWFSYGEERIGQGRENAKKFLIDHPEMAADIEAKVLEHFNLNPAGTAPEGE